MSITYGPGGCDDSPTRNTVEIHEQDPDTGETIFHTDDPEVIAQLWEWSNAVASA